MLIENITCRLSLSFHVIFRKVAEERPPLFQRNCHGVLLSLDLFLSWIKNQVDKAGNVLLRCFATELNVLVT